jgi:hypothetical protein
MNNRPSNILFLVLFSLAMLFGLYILGGFILDSQQSDSLESRQPERDGNEFSSEPIKAVKRRRLSNHKKLSIFQQKSSKLLSSSIGETSIYQK